MIAEGGSASTPRRPDDLVEPVPGRWSETRIAKWYGKLAWLVGANYLPATKINQIDMWQASTWDPARIDREFALAQSIGLNTMRVFLHPLVWEADAKGLYSRIDEFLDVSRAHGIRPSFVFFDDCHYPFSKLGLQPLPVRDFHNSGWVNAPARDLAERYARGDATPNEVENLKGYVQGTLHHFSSDDRVLYWELYNEPGRGNGEYDAQGKLSFAEIGDRSRFLVYDSWTWAREVDPSQPLTSTGFGGIGDLNVAINARNSDLYSIHCYDGFPELVETVTQWSAHGRPVIVTEWLNRVSYHDLPKDILALFSEVQWIARADGSNTPQNVLPFLKQHNVGAINWGFVSGRSATNLHWSTRYRNGKIRNLAAERAAGEVVLPNEGMSEPRVWFHDLFRPDFTPYDPDEIVVFKSLTSMRPTSG